MRDKKGKLLKGYTINGDPKTWVEKNCIICNKPIIPTKYYLSKEAWEKRKVCDRNCLRQFFKGRKLPQKGIEKMRISKTGIPSPCKGQKRPQLHQTNAAKTMFKKGHSSSPYVGKKMPLELKKKLSEAHLKGRKALTKKEKLLRNSVDYKDWRLLVFKRDNFTCQVCKYKSHTKINGKSDIQADHIKPWALYPELRLDINNGRTLCIPCHKNTDTYGERSYL